jgi:two-component system chemotaxis response regulator CheY
MQTSVLIVDDSATVRKVVKRTISQAGFVIDVFIEARNGIDALEQLQRITPSLVVTDINMPEMGGIELIEAMKQQPNLREIPCVVISTEGSHEVIDRMLELGVVGFIQKPFRPEELAPVIAPYVQMAVTTRAADPMGF